jgi:phosphatidylserine/phosphatidylglycerophosphate/cardiolipin synthase-like enzyme
MIIEAHFSDIQQKISEELNKAKYNVFVAVAWITDKSLWQILEKKAEDGVTVQVILVPDDINKHNNTDFDSFLKSGGQLFWDDHHHKFCVIDVKTVITGSYNWTYMANNRGPRENIVILSQNVEIAEQFSDEFKLLIRDADKLILPKEKELVYVDREVEKEIIKEVEVIVEVPVIKEVEKKIIKEVEKPIVVKEDVHKFKLYDKGGRIRCGKCHGNKLISDPKTPKNIKIYAMLHCKGCNTYYDKNGISI